MRTLASRAGMPFADPSDLFGGVPGAKYGHALRNGGGCIVDVSAPPLQPPMPAHAQQQLPQHSAPSQHMPHQVCGPACTSA